MGIKCVSSKKYGYYQYCYHAIRALDPIGKIKEQFVCYLVVNIVYQAAYTRVFMDKTIQIYVRVSHCIVIGIDNS